MPGVTVSVSPMVVGVFDNTFQENLDTYITRTIAEVFSLNEGPAGVGVDWIFPARVTNNAELAIRVEYSENKKFHPGRRAHYKLFKRLKSLRSEIFIPDSIHSISVWIIVHPGAAYGMETID